MKVALSFTLVELVQLAKPEIERRHPELRGICDISLKGWGKEARIVLEPQEVRTP